jgi:pyroglutamyl-peptidase
MLTNAGQATAPHHRPPGQGHTVLVTGFGPFPGVRINPTGRLMEMVSRRLAHGFSGMTAHGGRLTVRYAMARVQLEALLADARPDAVLLFGLASRSRMVRVERHARRLDSPLHPDAGGAGGAAHARGSDLPLTSTAALGPALAAIQRAGIRARISPSAGRYLCNAVYAAALERAAGRPVLFVHVPWLRPRPGTVPAWRVARWRPAEQALVAALASIAVQMATSARCRRLAQCPMA